MAASKNSNIKEKLFTAWCWAAGGLSTAFWASASIAGSFVSGTGRPQHYCMRRWAANNLTISRARVEIEGLEHVDAHRPQIFAVNHGGLHDILCLAAHLPVQFRWIAKKSLFKVPFMGWHMRRSGYIPIDRESPREAARSIMAAARDVANGINAVAFPEGDAQQNRRSRRISGRGVRALPAGGLDALKWNGGPAELISETKRRLFAA